MSPRAILLYSMMVSCCPQHERKGHGRTQTQTVSVTRRSCWLRGTCVPCTLMEPHVVQATRLSQEGEAASLPGRNPRGKDRAGELERLGLNPKPQQTFSAAWPCPTQGALGSRPFWQCHRAPLFLACPQSGLQGWFCPPGCPGSFLQPHKLLRLPGSVLVHKPVSSLGS